MALPYNKERAAGFIRSELLIREGEGRTLAYFLALFFLLGLGLALGRGSANTLFLKRFGVAYLPHVYVALSLCLGLASLGYAALADRIAPERMFAAITALFAAALVLAWLLMRAGASDLAFPLYLVAFGVISEVIALHATLYFGSNFDGDQVKRLLPLALAGIQAGELCGGLALAGLSLLMPMKEILLLWALICAVSTALIVRRHRRFGSSPYTHPPRRGAKPLRAAGAQLLQGLRFARQSDLLRYSSYGVLFMVVAVFTMSYCVLAVYTGNFRSEAELGIIFGLTTFVGGAVTLLVQIFFSAKLLQRFGVRRMNLAFPLTTVASFAGLLSFSLPAAFIAAFNQSVILPAIRNPSRNLLFQALPDYMQGRARALSLVLVLPLGILAAGALLQVLHLAQAPRIMPVAGILAALAYLYYSVKTNRAYLSAVLSTMAEKLYIPREHMGELAPERDPELYRALANGVAHEDEQISLTYAKALMQTFPADAWRVVLERLRGASSRTQDQLIRLVVPRMPAAERATLYNHLGTADPHQQATIFSILFAAKEPSTIASVETCLRSSNPRLAASGILGAHSYDLAELRDEAAQRWASLLASERSADLLAALDLLRRQPEPALFEPAARLLAHADDRVKRAALLALGQFDRVNSAALSPLLRSLMQAEDHSLRIAALRCAPQLDAAECRDSCLKALDDRHPQVVETALDVLGRQYGHAFVDLAFDWLEGNTGSPRAQRALVELLLRQSVPSARLTALARSRLGEALTLARALQQLEKPPAAQHRPAGMELLALALREKLDRVLALALTALEAVENRQLVRTVRAGLASKDPRHVARALEAAEDFALDDIAGTLKQIFNRGSTRERVPAPEEAGTQQFAGISDVLDHFCAGRDAWLRECAVYAQTAPIAGAP